MREDFQERIARIEGLTRKLDTSSDPACRAAATELVQSLLELNGAGLERVMEIVSETEGASSVIERFGRDSLVGSLLVLYGIHPEPLEERVRRGIDHLGASLQSQGAAVEVLAVSAGTVRLRVNRQTGGCASTAGSLKTLVEEAMLEFAPDAENLIVEGAEEQFASANFVPLQMLMGAVK